MSTFSKEVADQTAKAIFGTLHRQKFADWYGEGGEFDKFLSGDIGAKTEEEILQDIKKLFQLE